MICYHRKMHVSPTPQLNQKLLVASVCWWINPTHSHKCNYFICQRLVRTHRAQPRASSRETNRENSFAISPSFSSPVGSVPCNLISANHSLRAEVIISSVPFGPWRTLQAGYEFQSRYCSHSCTHTHAYYCCTVLCWRRACIMQQHANIN